MEQVIPQAGVSIDFVSARVGQSEQRIFGHTVALPPGTIKNPEKVIIIATPRTDLGNSGGIDEPGMNAVAMTIGEVTANSIQFRFRRTDYSESRAPGMIINIMIVQQ